MSETAPVRIQGLSHAYGATPVFRDVSFDVAAGELVAVLGASGSGKSTLLRAVAGFVTPQRGRIEIAGREVYADGVEHVRAEARRVGMMFQDYALFPHYSVAENVAFGIHRQPDRDDRVRTLLSWVGLEGMGDRMPAALSGGQQQRVALARALAPRPVVLLLDEPFANLDGPLRTSIGADVRRALQANETAALLVTHDRSEALGLADRVAVLGAMEEAHPATLLQFDTPERVYGRPKTSTAARLTGALTLIEGVAAGAMAATAFGNVPLLDAAEGTVTVVIRPETARFEPAADGPAVLVGRRYLGGRYCLTVRQSEVDAVVDWSLDEAPPLGSRGRLVVERPSAVV